MRSSAPVKSQGHARSGNLSWFQTIANYGCVLFVKTQQVHPHQSFIAGSPGALHEAFLHMLLFLQRHMSDLVGQNVAQDRCCHIGFQLQNWGDAVNSIVKLIWRMRRPCHVNSACTSADLGLLFQRRSTPIFR